MRPPIRPAGGAGRLAALSRSSFEPFVNTQEIATSRWDGRGRPLSWQAARTLYNVLDALGTGGATAHRLVVAIERQLRHEGVPAARRFRLGLACLEWSPLLAGRRRFWRLPVEERRQRLDRWSQAGGLRAGFAAAIHRRIDAARRDDQSSDGA